MKKIGLSLVLVVPIIAGCGMQQKLKHPEYLQQQEIIAKYADLPDAPFQAQLKKIATSQQAHEEVQLFYTFTMSVDDLLAFYQQQMERLGWELLAESKAQNYLLHYVKPSQVCSVLIAENQLSLYICNKKGA